MNQNKEKNKLELNPEILKIRDLSEGNPLYNIKNIFQIAFYVSQAFIFCIVKLNNEERNKIFNY